MLNACYKIFHVEGISPHRDYCFNQMTEVLSKDFEALDTPTVYLKTFDEVNEFYKQVPEFYCNYIPPQTEGSDKSFPPNSGTVGVFASNYMAYKNFLKTDKDYLFIFEDDVCISPNFATVVEEYSKELPEGWDFFAIFVPDDCLKWYNPDYNLPDRKYISRTYQDWSCAGYMVNRMSAEKAVRDVETHGVNNPIDWYIFNSRHLGTGTIYFNTYSPMPNSYHPVWFSSEASVNSTIAGESTERYVKALHSSE